MNTPNPTLDTIGSLRSTHGRFSDREVSEPDLHTVLRAATRAANSSARQSYSIIVLDDRDRMETLIGYQASRALIFCLDFHRLGRLAARLGREFDNDDIIGFITASVDTALAAQTAVIAARSLQIDSLVTNGIHRRPIDLVYRELKLPESSVFPLIAVLLGYARDDARHRRGRLGLEHVMHRGTYREPDAAELDQMIAEYNDPSLRLGMPDAWDTATFTNYLDWFFERWSGKPPADRVPAGKIVEIQERLARSGFWWPTR